MEPEPKPAAIIDSREPLFSVPEMLNYYLGFSRSVRTILIKPNWVRHEEDDNFPIRALVTSTQLIEAVVEACLVKYPEVEEITVGDVPLQGCDWSKLMRQAGIDRLMRKYKSRESPRIRFVDLRRELAVVTDGFIRKIPNTAGGDPKGYREIILDQESFLDPISEDEKAFRVSDYSPEKMESSHMRGFHRYLIAASALDCDLFINLPKAKTHQKSGLTGALKNLVGINGEKAYLVHYRESGNGRRGDEFPPNVPVAVVLQSRIRKAMQGRSQALFSVLRRGWRVLKHVTGIKTEGTRENLADSNGRFFTAAGSWHGNDTIWRMVYDLNRIIRCAPRQGGRLATTPQREYIAIADGIIAGEGNGPLQPLPVELGVLLASRDPFLLDSVMAQIMGLSPEKIPLLHHRREFADPEWGAFDASEVEIRCNGEVYRGIENLPVLHHFLPPPGWKGEIELEQREVLT
jgi:uncharacterized protein (DUF362 family)